MMIKIILAWLCILTMSSAQQQKDQDMDGVQDTIDQCADTPFLDEVNDKGCSVNTLIFPQEKQSGNLDISIGYGFENNEDLIDRETQYSTKLQLAYYLDAWSYSLGTGFFTGSKENGMDDTTLKIKRKFKLTPTLKFSIGAGIKLPTYDFAGNQTDFTLYSSITYYPVSALSFFGGASYTFIQDKEIDLPLHDITMFYTGSGYYFTKDFYASIAYSYAENKFEINHDEQSLIATLFYRIDKKWFATLSYSQQIADHDLHNAFNVKIGYSLW